MFHRKSPYLFSKAQAVAKENWACVDGVSMSRGECTHANSHACSLSWSSSLGRRLGQCPCDCHIVAPNGYVIWLTDSGYIVVNRSWWEVWNRWVRLPSDIFYGAHRRYWRWRTHGSALTFLCAGGDKHWEPVLIGPPAWVKTPKDNIRWLKSLRYPEDYCRTSHWWDLKAIRKETDDYKCVRCEEDDYTCLDVHHITYERLGHEKLADLRTYCRTCHDREHFVRKYYGLRLKDLAFYPAERVFLLYEEARNAKTQRRWKEVLEADRRPKQPIRSGAFLVHPDTGEILGFA